MLPDVINLLAGFDKFDDYWHPRIVGELNGSYVKLARLKGEFVWHHHEREDELFLVLKGKLTIRTHAGDRIIRTGEFSIITHGVEHCPVAEDEAWVLLLEPKTTLNTGNIQDEHTVDADWLTYND